MLRNEIPKPPKVKFSRDGSLIKKENEGPICIIPERPQTNEEKRRSLSPSKRTYAAKKSDIFGNPEEKISKEDHWATSYSSTYTTYGKKHYVYKTEFDPNRR